MIRVDYKKDGRGYVNTTWVLEDGDKHSNMGRLLFTEPDFDTIRTSLEYANPEPNSPIRFEAKG